MSLETSARIVKVNIIPYSASVIVKVEITNNSGKGDVVRYLPQTTQLGIGMANVHGTANVEENILYDLTIHAEWPLEPEITNRQVREKPQASLPGRLKSSVSRQTWTFLRSMGVPTGNASPCILSSGLLRLMAGRLNWQIAPSCDGRYVAVRQEHVIEVRCDRDEYSSVVGRCLLSRDPYPQWRQLTWSPDGVMIACSDSSGTVEIFDLVGTAICSIQSPYGSSSNAPVDLSHAVCSLIFKDYTESDDWVAELLVINYQGSLKSYLMRREGDYQLQHSFTFSFHYPRGISSVLYHEDSGLLLVGGLGDPESERTDPKSAMQHGISAWRPLSDNPHYKMVTDYEQDLHMATKHTLIRRVRSSRLYCWWYGNKQDGIYQMSLSPNGKLLAAVYESGSFSIWDVPSLRQRHFWTQEEQPDYNVVNEEIAENPKRRKAMKEFLQAFHLVDSNWWSDEAVILARGTGALSVSSIQDLRNLLGPSPEWFEPEPHVTGAQNGAFLGLECNCQYSSLKRRQVSHDEDDEYDDSDDDLDSTLMTRSSKYLKTVAYYVTDIERFQPPRKRPKLVTKTYRLVCLKSTTPEELYARKIDSKEYGEALVLAKKYGLDCDLVYQRQWRSTLVSVASIQDYLSKISKRSWVLHECLERVPDNIDAMKELLRYGLRGTDLEALITIGNRQDGGRFIFCDPPEAYEEGIDPYDVEAEEERRALEREHRTQQLAQVDFKSLTLDQRELCRARHRLLQYLDRLDTYEEILGGPHAAEERFDAKFFEQFRSQNIVELAVDYARAADWRALEVVFTYHGNETLPHRLAILSNFPETFSPNDYRTLLPEAGSRRDDPEVLVWEQLSWRQEDWVETDSCWLQIEPEPFDLGLYLYEEQPDYAQFRGMELNQSQLTAWYAHRACQIEALSRQVDCALDLVRLAMSRYVSGLDDLMEDLITMEVLVYDCAAEDTLTFAKFQEMTNIERLELMMQHSSNEAYQKNVKAWMVPFIQRCDKKTPGAYDSLMRDYLISMATEDLTRPLMIFQISKANMPQPVVAEEEELMSLALDCIYACTRNDQLSLAFDILECLPQREFGRRTVIPMLHNQVDELENHLSAADLLETNGLPQTPFFIKDTQNNVGAAMKLFTSLTRRAGKKSPPLDKAKWCQVLADLLTLQTKVYHCVPASACYEIFVESLLCSGLMLNIHLAGESIEQTRAESQQPDYTSAHGPDAILHQKVAYSQALPLVLKASQEYFDSSANLTDSNMELAKACLNLITDHPPAIQEELDLIESLALLSGFSISILPPQVRMCQDRLSLVRQALEKNSYAYQHSQKLLKLGFLLRVSSKSSEDRDGQVLQCVAEAALKAKDFSVAYDTCFRLMESGYSPIWKQCKSLAEAVEYPDIQAKANLLSYAVTYCTPELIEPILRAKHLLEAQILCERVQCQITDRDSASPMDTRIAAKNALKQTREILTSTTKTTKAVLSTMSDGKWWRRTLNSLHPQRRTSFVQEWDDMNAAMEKQGCHPFYDGIVEKPYSHKSEGDYSNFRLPKLHAWSLDFSEAVLRKGKLEECLTEGKVSHPATEVLLQLAQDTLAQDTSLGLAYLLALPDAVDADKCFEKSPRTAISLQIAAYYYAIQIYCRLDSDSTPELKPVYTQDPSHVLKQVVEHVTDMSPEKYPPMIAELIPRLQHYDELLTDFNQAHMLQGLGKGVDVARFTLDDEYKHETILGLAMNLEQPVYEMALSLAKRYKLPFWEVYMTHLEFLFDSGLSTSEIESRVSELGILSTLMTKATEFAARMDKYVYPSLSGTDHARLLYYYTLLEGCPQKGTIAVDTHVKLLKKIKPSAPGLDYKLLMEGKARPMDVVRPILNTGNVHVIAKLAPKMPDPHGGYLQSGLVFCAWATKVFWEGEAGNRKMPNSVSPDESSQADWIHRYEMCGEYMAKMGPEDVMNFMDGVVFVPNALEKLTLETRQEVLRRALKYCRQQTGKKKKSEAVGPVSWEGAATHVKQGLTHLESLASGAMAPLRDSPDATMRGYAHKYDLSRGQMQQMHEILVTMVLDGQDPQLVQDVLSASDLGPWTPQTAVKEAVQVIITQCSAPETESSPLGDRSPQEALQTVVNMVQKHQQDGGDLVHSEDVMTLIRPFCADSRVPVDSRLNTLQIVEQSFDLAPEDLSLLILYRTNALVHSAWPVTKVVEDVGTDSGRQILYDRLLSDSLELSQYMTLTKLVEVWPALPGVKNGHRDQVESHPWCRLVTRLVMSCGEAAASHVVDVVKRLHNVAPFKDEVLEFVFQELKNGGLLIVAVKVILGLNQQTLFPAAIEELRLQTEMEDDEELLLLILKCHLVTDVVNTIYYCPLVEYVINQQAPGSDMPYYLSVENIANQLQEAGHDAEAGTLIMMHRGTHPALRTFDAAISVLSKWFVR